MTRFQLIVLVATVLGALACEKAPPKPTPPSTTTTLQAPPVKDAVMAIYGAFAKDPDGYDRADVISRFYIESNQALDAECRAGKEDPRCRGDRFACLPTVENKRGVLVDATVAGELPNKSATVKVTLRFGKRDVKADVDVVYEEGAWKVDQVRCELPPQ